MSDRFDEYDTMMKKNLETIFPHNPFIISINLHIHNSSYFNPKNTLK